jgi:hypothetical protein
METALIVISVGLFILLLALGFIVLYAMSFSVFKDIQILKDMYGRLIRIETIMTTDAIMNESNQFMDALNGPLSGKSSGVIFTSPDGKYKAENPDELMKKMKADPQFDLSPEQEKKMLDSMHKFREEILGDDEDDDDDEKETWK